MNKTSLSIAILPFFLLLAGCGTDEYQARLEKGASSTSAGSKFDSVLGAETTSPGPLPNASVSWRMPKAMPAVNDINDPVRGKCPLIEIPGFKATYEGFVKDTKGNDLHYYLYVGASEQAQNKDLPTQTWLNVLRDKFPAANDGNSAEVNKNYSSSTPEGGSVQWEEIHFKGVQKFFYPNPENPQNNQDMSGTFVCLCRVENGVLVTLVFRYPSHFEERHSTDFDTEWLKLVAGCLKIGTSGG
jgi:hypothetical protein